MKNKKDIYGKDLTTFGYCLHIILCSVSFISFVMIIGYTGSCEHDLITLGQYVTRVFVSLSVFGSSIYLYKKIFN